MALDQIAVLAAIALFSVVQSFFGMGVLVFGTPTLLLMGYDFITALSYLLPASFAISLLQVLVAGSARVSVSPSLYFLCLPGIGVGLLFTDTSTLTSWSNVLIGGTLLVSALVRIWEPAGSLLNVMLEKHLQTYHLVMGLIHGLTNLGGAMLAILASGLNTEKAAIRYTVAHYYLAFSTIQMLLLATVMGQHAVLLSHLFTGVVSTSVFFLVGNRIFVRASNPTFNIALTIFIAAYGVIILLKL